MARYFAEVEEIKKRGRDYTLDIDIKPNRGGDCFSHLGVAREIAAILNLKLKIPEAKVSPDKKLKSEDLVSIEVKDEKACPRYTVGAVAGFKVGASPRWLADRLRACGLKPINNIVDIANYVMLETGQPLHAFDADKLEGKKLIVRFAREREGIVALDEGKYDLSRDILVIADAKNPTAVAGIKGGRLSGIDKKTKTIVLESANFDSRIIRKGSQKLKLRTDASWRFEHGLDPNLTELAVRRAGFLIQKMAGGKMAQSLLDFYPKKVFPKRISLDLNYAETLLGIKIPKTTATNILKRLGFRILKGSKVEVPTIRRDISLPEDLIEEVGRIYGYEKIPALFPQASLIPPERNQELFWENKIRDVLKEAGFTEIYNYSFLPAGRNLVELKNPLSREQKYLRNSLIPSLLKNIQNNKNYLKPGEEIRIFEVGKIFQRPRQEEKMLTGAISGDDKFYEAKGVVDLLLQKLGIANVWYDDYQASPKDSSSDWWQPGRCAEIKIGQREIGFLGEIKKEPKAAIFDFNFSLLQKLFSEEHEYRFLSRYPEAVRDLAVLVPLLTKVEAVLNIIAGAGGVLVRDVDLFDIYEGEELPGGKKNLAFHIIYQSDKKTLTSQEVETIHQKIIKALEKKPKWQVRK